MANHKAYEPTGKPILKKQGWRPTEDRPDQVDFPQGEWSSDMSDLESTEAWNPQSVSKISRLWGGARDGATQVFHRAQDIASGASQTVESTVKRYPVQSLALGLLVGCAMGYAASRRTEH